MARLTCTLPSRRRRGVSLMEVLFAIGIVITGLLGVISLLPVAAQYAAQGLRLDHATVVGSDAVHEIELRNMTNPNNWLMWNPRPDPANSNTSVQPPVASVNSLGTAGLVSSGESFCLDPRFVAFHSTPPWTINSRVFPYGIVESSGRPAMWRITLQSAPAAGRMSTYQSDSIFASQDDLAFSLPEDATLPPVQELGMNGEKRQYEGRMSWFATLVPRLSSSVPYTYPISANNSITTHFYDPNVRRNEYTLSVVVVHQRDASFEINPRSSPQTVIEGTSPNERVADVSFYGGFDGGGGGDVRLSAETPEDLELQQGDWILLCRYVVKAGTTPSQTPYFQWYRVATTEEEPRRVYDSSGNAQDWWLRDASLLGADWDTRSPSSYPALLQMSALPNSPTGSPPSQPLTATVTTQAVIVHGVISVFEKTVRLESSSLWAE